MLSKLKNNASIKFSKYIELKNPNYIYLKLTPNNSLRNNNTDQIAKAITSLYKSLNQCIYRIESKLYIEPTTKVSYYIYIENNKVNFYFIIPEAYLGLFNEKINNSWKGVTVKRVEFVPLFSNKSNQYYLTYKRQDGLSLSVDKRANTLLNSLLSVVPILKDGDKVGIFYNFIPISQYGWRAEYERTMDNVKNKVPLDKDIFGASYILKMLVYILINILETFENAIFGATGIKKNHDSLSDLFFKELNSNKLSDETIKKRDLSVLNTQIVVVSESKDRIRQNNNIRAVCESFGRVEGDNTFTYRRINHKSKRFDPTKLNWGTPSFKSSTDECHNFIQLPARELLEEHGCIEKIKTQETQVPQELRSGVMNIGENIYRGAKQNAYLTTDIDYRNLTLAILAPTRAGKTTLLQNLIKNAVDNGECVILPDFIDYNQFSGEIEEVIPKDKILEIDCNDLDKLQGLGFNECWINGSSGLERYDSAKEQTVQFTHLIDCINDDGKNLSAKMDRYLESAALVVFINYGSIGDIREVLRSHNVRHNFINRIPKDVGYYMEEYVDTLRELDDIDKKTNTIIGTKINSVVGILDRFNRLNKNTAMEFMLKKTCKNNVNFIKEIQKPQLISIKMNDMRYNTKHEKDFMTTYWLSKIWLALQHRSYNIRDRKKRVKVNIVIDELYQVPQSQRLLTEKLSQIAKYDGKIIISCHHLKQIPIIRDELKSANTSYMLLRGTNEENYNELKNELYPYTVEDLLNLEKHHSLNLIRYESGDARFITKLPKPIINK